jgi:hypothetical protein
VRAFVLLIHNHPELHLDLMLARPDIATGTEILWTWRLPRWPESGQSVPAERIADHSADYLEREGPTRTGKGSVRRIASGGLVWKKNEPEEIHVVVVNSTQIGELLLKRVGPGPHWVLERKNS